MSTLSHSHSGPTLEVSLPAIARNYALLKFKMAGKACGGVVKANAYGLGADHIAPVLFEAGCKEFFVATLEEAIALRTSLPHAATIYVFHGVRSGEAKEYITHHIIPVLNDLGQIETWNNAGPAALHIDTGMCRLGITPQEAKQLAEEKRVPRELTLVLSHLACANEPDNVMNAKQQQDFANILPYFPGIRASLCNSSGIFLGTHYHFDLARPGCSLYGISSNSGLLNPVENVVTLSAPVLQYRTLTAAQTIGYGATATAPKGSVLATLECGYADGFPRILSNKAHGFVAGTRVPIIGRVSMDMIIVDVSAVPEHLRTPDLRVTFIGQQQPVDLLAKEAGTIGYEIFTRLGVRVKRVYI